MKVKYAIMTLLIVGLVLGFSVTSNAALTVTVNNAGVIDVASTVAAGDSVVVGAFQVAGALNDVIAEVRTQGTVANGTAGVAFQGADILNVSVYLDNNNSGTWDANDTYVGKVAAPNTWNGGVDLVIDIDDITYSAAGNKYFIVVAQLDKFEDQVGGLGGAYDGATLAAQFSAKIFGGAYGANQTAASDVIAIGATHLKWFTALDVYADAAEITALGGDDKDIIRAVDDYGNLDADYAEKVYISAKKYTHPDQATQHALTATGGVGDASMSNTAAVTNVKFVAGVIKKLAAGNTAGKITSLKVTLASGTEDGVTLVASSAGTNLAAIGFESTSKRLIGTQTLVIGNANGFTATTIQNTRGIEIYDTNHNGKIDHVSLFFSSPVTLGGVASSAFTAQGYTVKSTLPAINYDAGGIGIFNGGPFAVTLELNEGDTTDTNARPDVAYNGSAMTIRLGTTIPTVGSAQAVEVDKARPVLMSKVTADSGIGTGTASNGIVDGFILTFSEPITNVSAGIDTSTSVSLIIAPAEGRSFNQGSGTVSDKTLTIPVGETIIDTGITPLVNYKQHQSNILIKDFSYGATGAADPNAFYPDKTTYANYVSFMIADGAPMVVHSVKTRDAGTGGAPSVAGNGKIDGMEVTFSEIPTDGSAVGAGVDFVSSVTAFGSTANGTYTVRALAPTLSGQSLIFPINEAAGTVYDTESVPSFQYNPSDPLGDIHDAANVELQKYGPGGLPSPTTIDGAAPVAVKVLTRDAFADTTYAGEQLLVAEGPDGRLDSIEIVFSEQVKTNGGAENGGTALDNAVSNFQVVHELVAGNRTKFTTSNAYGKPTWANTNTNGDTKSTLRLSFKEVSMGTTGMVNKGDTGKTGHTVSYSANGTYAAYNIIDTSAASNAFASAGLTTVSDGAAPFIIDGISKGWGANAFANLVTVDSDSTVIGGAGDDTGTGNGYIDGYTMKFTEPVWYEIADLDSLTKFTVDLPGAGELIFKSRALCAINVNALSGEGTDTITLLGRPDYKGQPDTDATPALTFAGGIIFHDVSDTWAPTTKNMVAAFTNKPAYDDADPVIVAINTGSAANKVKLTFSEPVSAHDSNAANISFATANKLSNVLFGYENNYATGATNFTSAYITRLSDRELEATVNADIDVQDIALDRMWVKSQDIWDNANAVETSLADNYAEYAAGGANIKINIFDDVVAPWITSATTIDADADGLVDHIRFGFSEPIKDSTMNGYLGANMMTSDVSATWKVSGYTGTAMFNLFDGTTNVGKAAAAAAGKVAFADNAANDAVLYLELQEALIPVNATTGIGSTQFAPTVTWGVGSSAVTLGDNRPNVLDTASTKTSPAAVNGTVTDAVGPVLMKAEYVRPTAKPAAEVGGQIKMYFSETLKSITNTLQFDDFTFSGDASGTVATTKLWGYSWEANGILLLTLKSDFSIPTNATPTIAITAAGAAKMLDVKDIALAKAGDAPTANAKYYKAASPINGQSGWAYADGTNATGSKLVATTTISGLPYITWTKFTGSVAYVTAGEPIGIFWSSANVTNVDLYKSYNGYDWTLVEGSTTAANAGTMMWTPQVGVTNLKLQATEDATIKYEKAITVTTDPNGNIGGSTIGAPANLVMNDVANDNGGFMIAQFTVSADHMTAVNSYQFYREMALDAATPDVKTWVLWAAVEKGVYDANMKQSVIVPTITNEAGNWAVRASTGSVISGATAAAKEAGDMAVATVVYGATEKPASGDIMISSMSNVVSAQSIDNIAPSAITDYAIKTADTGVEVSWAAAADHGIVGSYIFRGATQYIYGVSEYNVYRKTGSEEFALIGTATSGSTSYIDAVSKGATVYQYYVVATDGTYEVMSPTRSGIATSALQGDFTGDATINASDFSIFAANYGKKAADNQAAFVAAYDLNGNGVIDAADFSIFAAAYGSTLPAAKAAVAEMPTSDLPFAFSASVDEATSTYFLNVNLGKTESLKGFEFFLSYNKEAFEFMPNSVNGLVGLNMTAEVEDGIIRVTDWFAGEEFSGTVSLGFRTTGLNKTSTFEILNAVVEEADGLAHATNVSEFEAKALPTVYTLSQNYPNPFNPTTTIDYAMPKSGNVELVIYNTSGQKVRTLVSNVQDAGFYKVVWDGRNDLGEQVASGVYIYKLAASSFSKTVKMNLVK